MPSIPEFDPEKEKREHDLAMHMFAISAGLAGVCLTAIGLLRVLVSHTRVETMGEELLAGNALDFIVCRRCAFWSFKTPHLRHRVVLRKILDVRFLLGLMFLVAVCTMIAYAVI